MISETILPRYTNQQKLRILDIGCGNGSLSNFIAQHGYEVVGIRPVLKLASQYLQGFETNPCRFSLNVTIRV
ncbi:class I SAM-dependent methyltransferase [Calothrix sp. FACHB-1219]